LDDVAAQHQTGVRTILISIVIALPIATQGINFKPTNKFKFLIVFQKQPGSDVFPVQRSQEQRPLASNV
jgi:hypothetical protein